MFADLFLSRFGYLPFIIIISFITIFNTSTFSASGDLDSTFGANGKVITKVGKTGSDVIRASAIQPDGKIVTAGYGFPGPNTEYLLARFNTDGSLDTTFGRNGFVSNKIMEAGVRRDYVKLPIITSVIIQPDGKILADGYFLYDSVGDLGVYNLQFFIRLNPDGSFDKTFSDDGLFINQSATIFVTRSIALQADGKIVSLINREPSELVIARTNANGTVDTGFGNNGSVVLFNAGTSSRGYAVAVQPDGKIVAVGNNSTDLIVARLNTDGSFDTTFDDDGKLSTTFNGEGLLARSLNLQTDGKIVVAGYTSRSTGNAALIVRYNSNGSLDTTFDDDGFAFPQIALHQTVISSAKIQPDGKIVVGGYSSETSGDFDFTAARINSNGSLDVTFDADGIVKTPIGNADDRANSLNIQTDGKIVLSGYATDSSQDIALTRYNTDGSLDPAFDNDGISTIKTGNSSDEATAVAMQPDGKILVGGVVYCCDEDFALTRYNPDGTLDQTFGTNGIARSSIGTNINFLTGIKVLPDGKILVLGYSNNSSNDNNNLGLILARYNPDGSLDESFGTNGSYTSNRGSGDAFEIQADGKILVTGMSSSNITGFNRILTRRFNSDGTIDQTFGTNGEVFTTIFSEKFATPQRGTAMSVQTDGKIVVAATVYFSFGIQDSIPGSFSLIRLNTDGSLDTGFGKQGVANRENTFGGAEDLKIQADGKIVTINGYRELNNVISFTGTQAPSFDVIRFNVDGSVDNSFGNNGKISTVIEEGGFAGDLEIQTDGKIVVGGSSISQNLYNFALVRYNPNGSIDSGFGINGKVVTDFGGDDDRINGIALQNDGKIVAAGYSHNGLNRDFAIARYSGGAFVPARTPFDFDGDGKSDISVYRPAEGNWYLLNSTDGFSAVQWGNSTDKIVPADFDGDGRTDFAVFRPAEGNWYFLRSSDNQVQVINFGLSGDIPYAADFDGDGLAEITIFRPDSGTWYYRQNGQAFIIQFGQNGDIPVASDFDGDGKADLAVYRPSTGIWYILKSSDNSIIYRQFGQAEDKPTIGDFDGDGKTDIALWRPSSGVWYRINSSNDQIFTYQFGQNGDIPAVGDFDGDGRMDITVFRPSNGVWYRHMSSNGQFDFTQFGANGDQPIPAFYQP